MVAVLAVLALIVVLYGLAIALVQWAWNALMPAVFSLPAIEFWQAAALVILASLFKSGVSYARSRE